MIVFDLLILTKIDGFGKILIMYILHFTFSYFYKLYYINN